MINIYARLQSVNDNYLYLNTEQLFEFNKYL